MTATTLTSRQLGQMLEICLSRVPQKLQFQRFRSHRDTGLAIHGLDPPYQISKLPGKPKVSSCSSDSTAQNETLAPFTLAPHVQYGLKY